MADCWDTDAGRWLKEHQAEIEWGHIPLPSGVPSQPFPDGSCINNDPLSGAFWPVEVININLDGH